MTLDVLESNAGVCQLSRTCNKVLEDGVDEAAIEN